MPSTGRAPDPPRPPGTPSIPPAAASRPPVLTDVARRLAAGVRAPEPPWIVLGLSVALWIGVFGVLVWQRHDRFGSFGFDMGIFDQAVWLAARGKSFITVRGLDLFGHHANVGFYLLAPFSWVGAGPHFLNLFQVVALASGAIPLYLLGRHHRLGPWVALVPPAAYLLHPAVQFLAWELFHPETVAVTPLLFAYLAAVKERWRWYAAMLLLAVVWKEDVALAGAVLGVVVALRGRWRIGGATAVLSLGWFLVVNRIVLSAVNGRGAFYDQFYGRLGGSPFEIAWTALVHPTQILDQVVTGETAEYLWQLTAPFALVVVAAPSVLLLAVPQLVANVLSIHGFTREVTFHYAALPVAALSLASVEALARLGRDVRVRRVLASAMLVAAVASTVRSGPSPVGNRYDDGFWPAASDSRRATKDAAVALVPSGAPVSATYQFVPHLTHRDRVYEFPNPFRERNWGVRGEGTHDPRDVQWLAVDTFLTGREDRATLEATLSSGAWDVVMFEDGILVARRPE